MNMKNKPMFRIKPDGGFNNENFVYELYGKGKGIGDGISWVWLGTLTNRSYCYILIKSLTLKTKEIENG